MPKILGFQYDQVNIKFDEVKLLPLKTQAIKTQGLKSVKTSHNCIWNTLKGGWAKCKTTWY